MHKKVDNYEARVSRLKAIRAYIKKIKGTELTLEYLNSLPPAVNPKTKKKRRLLRRLRRYFKFFAVNKISLAFCNKELEKRDRNSLLRRKIKKEGFKSYRDKYYKYLLSPKWASIRASMLKTFNNTCQRCGFKTNKVWLLHVHHLTYTNLFNEDQEDLELLCVKCHKIEHGQKDPPPLPIPLLK